MDSTTTRMLWADAEREACALLTSPGDASRLLEMARCLSGSSNAGLRGYCQFWLGFFGDDEDAFPKASTTWQHLADNTGSDAKDRAWWFHCAVVSELLHPNSTNGPTPALLARAIVSFRQAEDDPDLADDQTARQTFSLLRAQMCFLAGEFNAARQIVENLWNGVSFKKSLAVELEGTALTVLSCENVAAVVAFEEAAKFHSLFIHKVRCRALARYLKSGKT